MKLVAINIQSRLVKFEIKKQKILFFKCATQKSSRHKSGRALYCKQCNKKKALSTVELESCELKTKNEMKQEKMQRQCIEINDCLIPKSKWNGCLEATPIHASNKHSFV